MKQLIPLFLFLCGYGAFAQTAVVNPRYQKSLWMFNLTYKAAVPAGSLALRYGYANGMGIDLYYKTKNNFLFGINANAYFGKHVRDINYINFLKDEHGFVFSDDGTPVYLTASMRGSQLQGAFGKLFPVFKKKPQLALLFQAGAGFMQHKYLFSAPNSLQFSKAYLKGYDRLSNGFALNEEAGICHLGLKKLINFNIGLEITEAFTKNRRYYDYATQATDTKTYLDIWVALKCCWVLPLKTHDKNEPVYFK